MKRFAFLVLLWLLPGLPGSMTSAAQTEGLPPRPSPFQFVNDQAQLLSAADAKKLESGLRRYADNTGTQVVVVTLPSLGGRDVADYGRALGSAWGVGQRDKNNGVVVLLGAQEHQVTIQAGSGLRAQITPQVTTRIISQQMTPSFKQGNYFAGLRAGLNALMLGANPGSTPATAQPGSTVEPAASAASTNPNLAAAEPTAAPLADPEPAYAPAAEPAPSGPGLGTLLVGALLVGGVLWLLVRLFRRRSTTPAPGAAPDFYGNAGPAGGYGRGPGYQQPGPGYGGMGNSGMGGSGVGGMLMTGAAAAAGAYLGNRMASGHDTSSGLSGGDNLPQHLNTGAAGAGSGGFPALDGTSGDNAPAPDYFADDASNSNDYFSSGDNSSYDDPSSGDSGGGGFDEGGGSSGSW
jgi:uncharacterized protein